MKKNTRRVVNWTLAGAWAAAIFAISSSPSLPKGPEIPGLDKMLHAGVYAILAWLLYRALSQGSGRARLNAWPLAVILAFLYGITDEIHQAFVPGRSTDFFDALADLGGAVLAWAAHARALNRPRRRR